MSPLLLSLVKVLVVFGGLMSTAAVMTLAERKVSAWIQGRVGPNRVGPWGLLQPLADGIKFLGKEEVLPDGANRLVFRIAPALSAMPALMMVAVIPFGPAVEVFGERTNLSIADLDVSVLYVLALGGLGIYGIILGGWASNSKYSLLGGLRATAQMISYELTLVMCVLAIVLVSGSLDLRAIVEGQQGILAWNVWRQPLACLLFVIATFAETNRHPFDFAECEPELVGGFHTEYSSMKFALFFIGEYAAMAVMACLTTCFFFGGYSVPFFADPPWWLALPAFLLKAAFFLFLFIWVRWSLPRFRYDQLMALGWKVFLPLTLLNLLLTGALRAFGLSALWLPVLLVLLGGGAALLMTRGARPVPAAAAALALCAGAAALAATLA